MRGERTEAVEVTHYSVGQAIDSLGFGKFQIFLSIMVGFAYMADAMEMMILSILGPALHCYWHITEYEQAMLTTVVFLGMLLSSSFWGMFADKYGRRVAIVLATVFLFYFGLLSSFSPSFKWMLFLRFLVGFFIGGIPQVTTLYAEYLPTKTRGKAILVLSFFWAIGASFEALLALITMGSNLGWRYLVGFSSMPLLVFLLFSNYLPESPMYLAVTGQKDMVERQLNKVAQLNNKPRIHGNLVLDEGTSSMSSRGRICDLFRGPNGNETKLTVMLMGLWFIAASLYYGVVLISTEMLNSSHNVCSSNTELNVSSNANQYEEECSLHKCSGLRTDDYVKLIWTTFAEFPGTLFALVLIDRIGRKKTLALQAVIFSVATLCLVECGQNKTFIVIVLFVARGVSAGFFQTVFVYTPEVYPTKLRALAMGTHSACARIGAMLTPYIAQVLLKSSFYSAVAVYVLLGMCAAVLSMFLPVETLGQSLDDAGSAVKSLPGSRSTMSSLKKDKDDGNGLIDEMEENEIEGAAAPADRDTETKERY